MKIGRSTQLVSPDTQINVVIAGIGGAELGIEICKFLRLAEGQVIYDNFTLKAIFTRTYEKVTK